MRTSATSITPPPRLVPHTIRDGAPLGTHLLAAAKQAALGDPPNTRARVQRNVQPEAGGGTDQLVQECARLLQLTEGGCGTWVSNGRLSGANAGASAGASPAPSDQGAR